MPATIWPFLDQAPRHLFFTGKGGVGKTSIACAGAIRLAQAGKRVLLVSTDPASNLDEVLATPLTTMPTAVASVPGLSAQNLDPVRAAAEYRERVVAPYRTLLPAAAVRSIEEQLSGACTVEIAAFDVFASLLADTDATRRYDHIIFDTAPTGHTLRLLALPGAWTDYLKTNAGGTSCLGPLSGLAGQTALYASAQNTLRDPQHTAVVLVARPERAALKEAERTRAELIAQGMLRQELVVNGVFHTTTPDDAIAVALTARGEAALQAMPTALAALPRIALPLLPFGLVGIDALASLLSPTPPKAATAAMPTDDAAADTTTVTATVGALVEAIAAQTHGVVMTVGKGGVGKTTVAVLVARALAERGHTVLLTTTDPAAHVADAVGVVPEHLTVARIDPVVETERYAAEVMATAGAGLDTRAREVLQEDLRSPCTEEIAVFRAFAQAVDVGQHGFVVIDTAPTGHTLLLLDAALAYQRDVARTTTEVPDAVKRLLPRLRDRVLTKILIVTHAEATPVHEALMLQNDLLRADIHPFAWVINQSLATLHVTDPVLVQRQRNEIRYQREIAQHSDRVVQVPFALSTENSKVEPA